jgi:hypothetical protein
MSELNIVQAKDGVRDCLHCAWTDPKIFDGTCPPMGEIGGDFSLAGVEHDCFVPPKEE